VDGNKGKIGEEKERKKESLHTTTQERMKNRIRYKR
jgi:hypothetical protein